MKMDSSENLDAQERTNNAVATEASQVTVLSHNCGGPTLGSDNSTTTRTSAQSTERNLVTGDVQKKPTLMDFAEQIRQLEIEGNKLRAANLSSLADNLNGFSFDANDYEMPKLQSPSLGNLSTLIDISSDQKYIAELRVQLEKQSRETERLQKQLLGDMPSRHCASTNSGYTSGHNSSGIFSHTVTNGGSCLFMPHSQAKEKPAFSTIPSNELHQFLGRRFYDYEPPSHLERSLKESQEQVMDLRKKLQVITESSELQKKQFRKAVEDLKSKLHDTILNRDTVLDLRQKESNSQELLINKLQSSFTELQERYKMQEEALASASKKLESYNQSNNLSETALFQIRAALMEKENRRGRSYFEADPASGQSVAMLAHTLERCLQELEHEVKIKSCRVSELESEVNEIKMSSAERERIVAKEFQEMLTKETNDAAMKISHMQAEHEKSLANVAETNTVAMQQVSKLQNQIQENETINQQKLKAQELQIKELEEKINELKTDNMKARTLWQEKHQALELSLDQVQRELIETRMEKNELIQTEAVLRSQLDDFQLLMKSYESDIETERDKIQQQRKREEDLRSQVMDLEIEVTNKQGDIDRLEKMLEVVKQECSATVSDKIASVEKLERDRYLDQIKYLSTQLAIMTDRCNKAIVEQQVSKNEMDGLRSQVCDLTSKLEDARSQMESALSTKSDLTALLGDKHEILDRLHRDKEYYVKLAEQKADEVTELNITLDRLKTQLDEKEKILSTFRQQSCSISQLMEVNSKASESIREEKDKLALALAEKIDQMEELKVSHDSFSKKVKVREKRIKHLEDEVLKMSEEIVVKNQELELLHQEKENIITELKESRTEVANLVSSQDALKKEVARIKTLRFKEINKLQTKLKESEQGYKLTQKALRSKDIVDHRAVKFADRIQKEMTVKRSEIDQLLSKLHRLEEDLETVTKEKSLLEKDKDSLKKGLAKSLIRTKELSEELQKSEARKREFAIQITRLEEELEQAVLRAKTSSAMVDKFEQEVATLKLKHQLDLKEAERLARIKNGRTMLYTTTASSSLSTESPSQHQNINFSNRKTDVEKELSSLTNYGCESEVPITMNCLHKIDDKHKDYSKVGRELKSLVADMKNLVSGHDKAMDNVIITSQCNEQKETIKGTMKKNNDVNTFLPTPMQVQELSHEAKIGNKDLQTETDLNKSWGSRSLSRLGDLSDFSSYKDWRPRSSSLTRNRQLTSLDLNAPMSTNIITKGGYFGSPQKLARHGDKVADMLPNTQELCRRLEEKIDSLTRMGGNLVKENKEMAELINLQGQKLGAIKQTERNAWEQR